VTETLLHWLYTDPAVLLTQLQQMWCWECCGGLILYHIYIRVCRYLHS